MIQYTKQEKKNHKNFALNIMMFLISGLMLTSNNFYIWSLGWLCAVFSWFLMAKIGYDQGWELKRISIK